MQIPALRMPYNGLFLVLHEFFHVVENMMHIRPRHGFHNDKRHHFPGWNGRAEINYYIWQFSKNIPRILEFKSQCWSYLNFHKRYRIRNVR